MKKQTFKLHDQEFIQLDQLLKLLNIASSGGEAHMMIEDGIVRLNGEQELRKRKKLYPGDVIDVMGSRIEIIV